MKQNKHYLNIIKLIKKNKPENSSPVHGGLVLLLILNLFFGGCLMSHSNSTLEKKIDALDHQLTNIQKDTREHKLMWALYIMSNMPQRRAEELFDILNKIDRDRVEFEKDVQPHLDRWSPK